MMRASKSGSSMSVLRTLKRRVRPGILKRRTVWLPVWLLPNPENLALDMASTAAS